MTIKFNYYGSALVFDADAQSYFDAVLAEGSSVTDAYKILYNNTILALKANGEWAKRDSIFIFATGVGVAEADRKIWSKIDIKEPTRIATINNDYSGAHVSGQGFLGNGTNFSILTNFNPGNGGTYNFTQNYAGFDTLVLTGVTGNEHDISCFNAGFTQGIFFRNNTAGAGVPIEPSLNEIFNPNETYSKVDISKYRWAGKRRTSSTTSVSLNNGYRYQQMNQASTVIENKSIGLLGAYNGIFAGGFYSTSKMGVVSFGAGDMSQNLFMNALNDNFLRPQATIALIDRIILFEGDSRTGSVVNSTLSNTSAYPKRVLSNLGNNWSGITVSEANETVQSMTTQYASEVQPYVNSGNAQNLFILFGGTNDIAAGRTAAQIKTDIETLCQAAKNDGYTVVIVGEIDRNWTSYAAMNAVRATLRTNMLADFSDATIEANIYTPPVFGISYADFYIDTFAEADFQSYLSAWYQADGIHPNTTGSNVIGDYVSAAIQLI